MIFEPGQTIVFRGQNGPARAARFVAEARSRAELAGLRTVRLLVPATLTLEETGKKSAAESGLSGFRSPLSALALIAFGVCGAAPAGFGSVPSPGFPGSFPGGGLPLASVTMEPWQIGLGAVGFAVLLIGYHFKIGDYIREQAGTPEKKQSITIDPPTLTTQKAPRWATWDEVEALRRDVSLLRQEGVRMDKEMRTFVDLKFHDLSVERSENITRLHTKIEASTSALGEEIDTKIDRVRKEITELPGRLIAILKDTGAIGRKGA